MSVDDFKNIYILVKKKKKKKKKALVLLLLKSCTTFFFFFFFTVFRTTWGERVDLMYIVVFLMLNQC